MALFHVNPQTGDAGECSATVRCPFGSSDDHYTSPEAARAAFESTQELFPSLREPSDPAKLFDRMQVMSAGDSVTEEILDKLPVGSGLVRIHGESRGRSYFIKVDKDTVRGLDSNGGMGLIAQREQILFHGSASYYTVEQLLETDFNGSQLRKSHFNRVAVASEAGAKLHEAWSALAEDKLSSVSYEDLPKNWQEENFESAKAAHDIIIRGVANEWTRKAMGALVHQAWLKRNEDRATAEQRLPFSELSKAEQYKDYLVLETVAEVIGELSTP